MRPNDGTIGTQKQQKIYIYIKGTASSPYVEVPWWHPPTPKITKQKIRLLILNDGAQLHPEATKKKGGAKLC